MDLWSLLVWFIFFIFFLFLTFYPFGFWGPYHPSKAGWSEENKLWFSIIGSSIGTGLVYLALRDSGAFITYSFLIPIVLIAIMYYYKTHR